MNLNYMAKAAHENSRDKGFWDGPFNFAEKIALIHSEASEALEEHRSGLWVTKIDPNGKPIGVPSELADILIRVGDLAAYLGIDLEAEVAMKMAYNRTRPPKHGKAY